VILLDYNITRRAARPAIIIIISTLEETVVTAADVGAGEGVTPGAGGSVGAWVGAKVNGGSGVQDGARLATLS